MNRLLALHLSLIVTAPVVSMLPSTSSAQLTADEFVALSATEEVAAEDWFALAQRARKSKDFDTAKKALDNATGVPQVQIMLERARIAAASGSEDEAVDILQSASDNGFTAVRLVTGDAALRELRGNSRFDRLVEAMKRQAFPCLYDDMFRQFDFWIGEWDVHTAGGQYAGSNVIEREESGCVITESWSGASGSTGSSVNFVDKATNEWVQVWNSESGAQISIRGGLTPDGMRLVGHLHNVAAGTTSDFRGLWTALDDGRVRQFFESSADGGKTWTPWFDGYYTRRSTGNGEN